MSSAANLGSPPLDDARAVAVRALSHWGLDESSELTFLKFRENAVFGVRAGADRYALRLHRPGYHSDRALRSELLWMTALADNGFPVPRIQKTLDGALFAHVTSDATYQCDLLTWATGETLGRAEKGSALDASAVADTYRTLGRLAAQLHTFSASWSRAAQSFERHSWNEVGCMGPGALWGDWADLQSLSSDDRTVLRLAADIAKQRLIEFGKDPGRYGLIHGDLVPENVLSDEGRLTVLDFDDAGWGWYLWEIVTAVFFLQGTPAYSAALPAMVEGYRSIRPMPDSDLRVLPAMLVVRGLVYLGWFHTRRETETAREMSAPVTQLTVGLARRLLAQK